MMCQDRLQSTREVSTKHCRQREEEGTTQPGALCSTAAGEPHELPRCTHCVQARTKRNRAGAFDHTCTFLRTSGKGAPGGSGGGAPKSLPCVRNRGRRPGDATLHQATRSEISSHVMFRVMLGQADVLF